MLFPPVSDKSKKRREMSKSEEKKNECEAGGEVGVLLTWRLEAIGEGERARVQRARVVGPVIQTGRCCVVIMGHPALSQHRTAQ